MPLQNRVLPTGQIVAIPERGGFTGNRGILHGPDHQLGAARWKHKAWICCVLNWQDRKRPVMTGRNWTELFFLDEAVAMAAGHRPCAYCRRADYNRYRDAWERATGHRIKAPAMDAILHTARVNRDRSQVRYRADLAALPDGAMILIANQPALIWRGQIYPYTPSGYGARTPKTASGGVTVLTPAPMVAVLAAGYVPHITFPPQESDFLDDPAHSA